MGLLDKIIKNRVIAICKKYLQEIFEEIKKYTCNKAKEIIIRIIETIEEKIEEIKDKLKE